MNFFQCQWIETIDNNENAYDGGILNCITWNVWRGNESFRRESGWYTGIDVLNRIFKAEAMPVKNFSLR